MLHSVIEGEVVLQVVESPQDGNFDVAYWSVMRDGEIAVIDLDIVIDPVLDRRQASDLRSSIRFFQSSIVRLRCRAPISNQLFDSKAVEVARFKNQFMEMSDATV